MLLEIGVRELHNDCALTFLGREWGCFEREQKQNCGGLGTLWELNSLCCLEALKIYMELKECGSDSRCLPNFWLFMPQSCGTYLVIN